MDQHHGRAPRRHCMVVFANYPVGETRVQRQAEALIQQGFKVDILCLRDPADPRCSAPVEVVNGAQVYRLPIARSDGKTSLVRQFTEYLIFFWLAMLALMCLHLRRRYRIVQVHNLPDFLVFAAWFPKLLGARLILDLHDLMPEFFAARAKSQFDNWLLRLVALQEQLSCRFADHVITVTDLWRVNLIQRGVPASRVSVVMNVADERIFRPDACNGFSKADEGFHIVYHGAIPPRYGVDLVLEAIALLRKEFGDITFTIYSWGGGYRDELLTLANKLSISDRVELFDALPAEKLPEVLCTADVGIVPNRQDAFTDWLLPTKLMEYVAIGLPVIAAKTRAISTYFDDNMLEFFIPGSIESLASTIVRLHHDRQRLRLLAIRAGRFNLRHNWRTEGANYVALVERLSSPPVNSLRSRARLTRR